MRFKIKVTQPQGNDDTAIEARKAEWSRIRGDLSRIFGEAAIRAENEGRQLISLECDEGRQAELEERYRATARVTQDVQYPTPF